jgi:hypothetical protein
MQTMRCPGAGIARYRLWMMPFLALAAACGEDGVADPVEPAPPNAVAGRAAFESSCASCHASRDGLDLAYFDFAPSDIVRRGLDHVSESTARDIVAWLEGLPVDRQNRSHRLFQPAGRILAGDAQFWLDRFGTTDWPANLTPAELSAVDLREVPVPLPFPLWSSESDESDWMPERPLPRALLEADGGALAFAIETYYANSDVPALTRVIDVFDRVSGRDGAMAGAICEGTAGAHVRPVDCFEARRWISSLAAQHLLRTGDVRDVPHEVAAIWWDTGEAAVTASFRATGITRRDAVAWLYLASVFAPDGILAPGGTAAEDAGYMGQFLVSEGMPRLATYVTLRRMVATGPIHEALPEQAYWDLLLATVRAPRELRAAVAEFGLRFLLDMQASGVLPKGEAAAATRSMIGNGLLRLFVEQGGSGDPAHDEAVRELIGRVMEGLGG